MEGGEPSFTASDRSRAGGGGSAKSCCGRRRSVVSPAQTDGRLQSHPSSAAMWFPPGALRSLLEGVTSPSPAALLPQDSGSEPRAAAPAATPAARSCPAAPGATARAGLHRQLLFSVFCFCTTVFASLSNPRALRCHSSCSLSVYKPSSLKLPLLFLETSHFLSF